MEVVLVRFEPKVACGLARGFGGVLIVVFVRALLVADRELVAVVVFAFVLVMIFVTVLVVVLITVLIVVLVAVVVSMVVSTALGGHGHGEGRHVLGLELKDVLAFFKVVNRNRRAGRTVAVFG